MISEMLNYGIFQLTVRVIIDAIHDAGLYCPDVEMLSIFRMRNSQSSRK